MRNGAVRSSSFGRCSPSIDPAPVSVLCNAAQPFFCARWNENRFVALHTLKFFLPHIRKSFGRESPMAFHERRDGKANIFADTNCDFVGPIIVINLDGAMRQQGRIKPAMPTGIVLPVPLKLIASLR